MNKKIEVHKNLLGEELVEITPEVAAAIVRSSFIPQELSGTGALDGSPAMALLGKKDLAKMVREDLIPKGVRIVGSST